MTENKSTQRWDVRYVVLLVLLAAGAAVSFYLLWEHLAYSRGQDGSGLCNVNETYNCKDTLTGPWSRLVGVPVPVFSIALYVGLFVTALRRNLNDDDGALDLVFAGLVFALGFSAFMLYIMLVKLDTRCPGCFALDTVTVLALLAAAANVADGPVAGLRRVFRRPSIGSAATLVASSLIVAVVGAFTANALAPDQNRVFTEDEAFTIVENYPTRYELDSSRAPTIGPDDASVVIVEFSDFECRYCGRFKGTLEQVREDFPDDVQVRFMHYPLDQACNPHMGRPLHDNACRAARAAVCAQQQGEFWPLHDTMFDNRLTLAEEDVLEYASELNLDFEDFQTCYHDEASLVRVQSDITAARGLASDAELQGLGTPFCVINGYLVMGNRPYGAIRALVQSELNALNEGEQTAAGEAPSQ